jgi:YD repeat-containing protein
MRSDFLLAANQVMLRDPRVQQEFGNNVQLRAAIGWRQSGVATVYGYVRGGEAYGFARFQLAQQGELWRVADAAVRDVSEDHILNLMPASGIVSADRLRGTGRLYLVALGSSATGEVSDLARFLQEECGVQAEILPAMELPEATRHVKRKQWIADMLIDAMAARFPGIAGDADARIVGVIDDDIYPRSLNWDFTFDYRFSEKYAVLQTQRLDPGFSRHKPSAVIKTERLRKSAMKCLGMLYFRFRQSSNPESLMSFEGSLQRIDEQSSHYLLSDLASQDRNEYIEGQPCLSFSSVNVDGLQPVEPIHACYEPYDLSQSSYFQINLSSGEFRTEHNDVFSSGPLAFYLRRGYASHTYDGKIRAFGKGTWQNLDDTVWSTDSRSIQTINIAGVEFKRTTPGIGFSPSARYYASGNAGDFTGAWLSWEGRWKIESPNGTVWHYRGCDPNSAIPCYFIDRTDALGDRIAVERNNVGHIDRASQEAGPDLPPLYAHAWTFTYDGDRVQRIEDQNGQKAHYVYDADSYLKEVRTDTHQLRYDYDEAHRMASIIEDGREVGLHYDGEGRVVEVDFASHPAYRIRYKGETVEVLAATATYSLQLTDKFFHLNHTE